MSLAVVCDLCGEIEKHAGSNKDLADVKKLENWLLMEHYDFCPNCLKEKLDFIKFKNGRYRFKKDVNEEEVEKIIREKGV